MASFHNWTGDEEIDTQVPQFLNEDNTATQEKLDTKFNKSLDIAEASDLNNFKDEGFYCCNSNYRAETILNCPTNYAFGLMVWGKGEIVYQEVREYNRSSKNQDYNNCWRRSYYSESGQNVWSNWQKMSYAATTLAGYGITDGMGKNVANSVGVPDFLKSNSNTSYLRLAGGDTFNKSATLQLYGGIHTTNAGQFLLNAADSTHSAVLSGSPSGILKWNNKNIVRSINNVAADENGNVAINVSGGGSSVTVDTELSGTSNNAIANKAVYNALLNKADTDIFRGFILSSPTATIAWRQGSQRIGSINASNYTGTAAMATSDGDGNTITSTYAKKSDISGVVKSVNGVQPDTNGNVSITVGGGGVSTSEPNTWTGKQTFQKMKFNFESYSAPRISGGTDNPSESLAVYNVQGNFTLDMSVLAGLLSNSDATLFTAYITANGSYTLSITNAGTLKYVGNASDLAITANGLLLNILLIKSSSGGLSSVVQASALS